MIEGLAVWTGLVMLFCWFGSNGRKKVAGLGLWTDIATHVILQVMLGGDGEGRMAMVFAGVYFNATLLIYRRLRGYYQLTPSGWVPMPGWFWKPQRPAHP